MMNRIDINCDVGEGIGNEPQLMPYIQTCNVACGGHAGNEYLMEKIVNLSIKHRIKIGAHPSYPDKENFGRKSMNMDDDEFIFSIRNQIGSLHKIVINSGEKLNHIKAHGALYNDLIKSELLSINFLNAISPYKNMVKLFVPYGSAVEKKAIDYGYSIVYEAFADRNYNDDLSLVSREKKNAVLSNSNDILEHVFEIINNGEVTTITGKKISIQANTFCVHSDTKNAVNIVKILNNIINKKL